MQKNFYACLRKNWIYVLRMVLILLYALRKLLETSYIIS